MQKKGVIDCRLARKCKFDQETVIPSINEHNIHDPIFIKCKK